MTPSVPLRPVPEAARELLDSYGGAESNLYRALANNEATLVAWIGMAWGLRTSSTTPRALRELMILRSAQVHQADYQWSDHFVMALAAGVRESQIEGLAAWRGSDLFDGKERAVLALTEGMLAGHVTDAVIETLEEEFDPEERVELIVTAGFYCMVPRVLDALRLQPG